MYNELPSELWITIIMNLNCRDILIANDISLKFKDLIVKNNIFETRKYKGFPRLEKHCSSQHISNSSTIKGS